MARTIILSADGDDAAARALAAERYQTELARLNADREAATPPEDGYPGELAPLRFRHGGPALSDDEALGVARRAARHQLQRRGKLAANQIKVDDEWLPDDDIRTMTAHRLPVGLWARVKALSEMEGRDSTSVIIEALEAYASSVPGSRLVAVYDPRTLDADLARRQAADEARARDEERWNTGYHTPTPIRSVQARRRQDEPDEPDPETEMRKRAVRRVRRRQRDRHPDVAPLTDEQFAEEVEAAMEEERRQAAMLAAALAAEGLTSADLALAAEPARPRRRKKMAEPEGDA